MTLRDYAASYGLAHDVATATVEQLGYAVAALDAWNGAPIEVSALSDDLLNRWITSRLAAGKSRKTVRNQRGAILTLWRSAADEGLVAVQPRKVKPVKVPSKNPDAWWPDEMARLLRAAEQVPGRFKAGFLRADFFAAWLLVAYYSLLRPCDLRKLLRSDVRPDGGLLVDQQKTAYPVSRYLPPDAMEALAKIKTDSPLLFPLRKKTIDYWWRWLKKHSGVPGSQKWLRRTGATQCEILQPGSAMSALGHKTPGLAYKHYVDQRQIQQKPVTPPKLG